MQSTGAWSLQIFGLPENSNAMIAAARVHSVLASEDLCIDPESAGLPHDETLNSITQLYSWAVGTTAAGAWGIIKTWMCLKWSVSWMAQRY